MMRLIALAVATLFLLGGTVNAGTVNRPPVITRDPGAYAQQMADMMALGGVQPLRETFMTMLAPASGHLPDDIDSSLRVYENPNLIKPAQVARIIDDEVLGDSYRVVFLYHYFDSNYWIFTRLEFVRISPTEWTLTRLSFADTWNGVALPLTPGFQPASRTRR